MGRKPKKECPIKVVLDLIGNKWKILIIRDLLEGKKRFGELRNATTASQKVLTSNLREMEKDELITRTVYAEVPPRVEYALTDIGYSLAPILDSMAEWGSAYQQYTEIKKKLSASV